MDRTLLSRLGSFKYERDEDALVVMRKSVFDEIYTAACAGRTNEQVLDQVLKPHEES
jgi:hypothetical protein